MSELLKRSTNTAHPASNWAWARAVASAVGVWHAAITPNRVRRFVARIAMNAALMFGAAPVSAADVAIAVVGPASGPLAIRTQAMLTGARRAADAANADGGVKGAPLRVNLEDDGCDPTTASTRASALAARKVDLVIGHPCTKALRAAAKIYSDTTTLFIATAYRQAGPLRSAQSPTLFRLSGRDDRQGADAARLLSARFKGQTIAIVHDRTRYARSVADATVDALLKAGMRSPITATLVAGEKDFPLVTAKIKTAAAIFYAGYPLEAGLLIRQLRTAGSTAEFLLSDSNGTRELTDTFGDSILGVSVMRPRFALTDETDTAHPDADARSIAADTSLAEAAVEIFVSAARATERLDPAVVASDIATRAHMTHQGKLSFDKGGESDRPSFDATTWTGKDWTRNAWMKK